MFYCGSTHSFQIRAAKAGIDNIHVPLTTKIARQGYFECKQTVLIQAAPDNPSEINGNTQLDYEVDRMNQEKRLPSGGEAAGTIEWESFMRVLDAKVNATTNI